MHNEISFPLHAACGAAYLTAPNIAARHAFSTRLGGVSTGVLESLNLSVRRGDTPENVREAVEACAPDGVDFNSGLESEPGRKDPSRMRAAVAALRG